MDRPDNLSESESAASEDTLKPANTCVLVIFCIAGDLTKRLLYPAICNFGSRGLLDENFCIVGVAMEPYKDESFRNQQSLAEATQCVLANGI
jgi:glucose-6-phosphate 1-dehydrogenase